MSAWSPRRGPGNGIRERELIVPHKTAANFVLTSTWT